MNNKELVNAGHELAKAISNDMPLIEIAKMVSNLATQLDVQIARSNQLSIALEAAEKRIAELEAWEVKLPERYEVDMCPTPSPDGEWYSREDILAALVSAGVRYAAAGKGE